MKFHFVDNIGEVLKLALIVKKNKQVKNERNGRKRLK